MVAEHDETIRFQIWGSGKWKPDDHRATPIEAANSDNGRREKGIINGLSDSDEVVRGF